MRLPLSDIYEGDRVDGFDQKYVDKVVRYFEKKGIMRRLFNDYHVAGIENVAEIADKQTLFVSNHVAMADFIIQGRFFATLMKGQKFPRFITGENMFKWWFANIFKKFGAISIDRSQKGKYLIDYNNWILESFRRGNNHSIYAEAGRNSGTELKDFKTTIFGQTIQSIESSKAEDIQISPVYINYDNPPDHLRLAWCFKSARDKVKNPNLKKILDHTYFATDFISYVYRVTLEPNKGDCYLYFGKPFSVKGAIKEGKNKRDLAEITKGEVEKLKQKFEEDWLKRRGII